MYPYVFQFFSNLISFKGDFKNLTLLPVNLHLFIGYRDSRQAALPFLQGSPHTPPSMCFFWALKENSLRPPEQEHKQYRGAATLSIRGTFSSAKTILV